MRPAICILNFHGIGTLHDGVGPDEARYWVTRDRFLDTLDRAQAHSARGRPVRITFDDGNRSDLEIAAPVLRDRGLSGDFFVLTGRLGDPRYLSEQDIKTLQEMGMGIGLHGRDHIDWRKADDARLKAETITARDTLAQIVGQQVATVGVPFGAYNARVIKQLRHAGFRQIYTSDGGLASENRVLQHRTSVQGHMDADRIDGILAGREPLSRKINRALKTWLKSNVL